MLINTGFLMHCTNQAGWVGSWLRRECIETCILGQKKWVRCARYYCSGGVGERRTLYAKQKQQTRWTLMSVGEHKRGRGEAGGFLQRRTCVAIALLMCCECVANSLKGEPSPQARLAKGLEAPTGKKDSFSPQFSNFVPRHVNPRKRGQQRRRRSRQYRGRRRRCDMQRRGGHCSVPA